MIQLMTEEQEEEYKRERRRKLEMLGKENFSLAFLNLESGNEYILYATPVSKLIPVSDEDFAFDVVEEDSDGSFTATIKCKTVIKVHVSIYLTTGNSELDFPFIIGDYCSLDLLPDQVDLNKLKNFIDSSSIENTLTIARSDPLAKSLGLYEFDSSDEKLFKYFQELTGKEISYD